MVIEAETPEELTLAIRQLARKHLEHPGHPRGDRSILPKAILTEPAFTTYTLAAALGIPVRSVPPTVNGWGRRAEVKGYKLGELVNRRREFLKHRMVTIYSLTDLGRKLAEAGT